MMRTVLSPFLLVFTLLLSTIGSYIGWRLAEGPLEWAALLLVGFLLMLFPVLHWRGRSPTAKTPLFGHVLQLVSYVVMGLMSWLLVVAVVRDLFLLPTLAFAGSERASELAAHTRGVPAFLLALFLNGLGVLQAFRGLRVREVKVRVPGLPPSLEGLRIVQISDLHIGPTIRRGYVQKVAEMARNLGPDLTVLTGDIVDGSVPELREHAAPLAGLSPPGHVFLSPGNHDYYSDLPSWLPEFGRLGCEVLMNRGRMVRVRGQDIWVGGVTDPVSKQKPDAAEAMRGGERAVFRLLLSHRPELAEAAEAAGFQLQLSGHTHGGQFFPWTLVAKRFHRFYLGLMKQKEMWVYVSPGTGTWGPPVRVGTTPEVTLLELRA
jgi:predicted MPP superfamily phosphohydrolase